MRLFCTSALVLAAMIPASLAWGQNLVSNPGFDIDVADWTSSAEASLAWDPLDVEGNPVSGSALVTNLSISAGDATGASQCIDGLTAEAFYEFAAEILVPSGQSETGHAFLFVQWNDEPGCSGYLGSVFSPQVPSSTPDVWYGVSNIAQAPLGTESARLRLSVWKYEDVGSLEAHFDNVEFEAMVFVDGFESGDTTMWSLTVP